MRGFPHAFGCVRPYNPRKFSTLWGTLHGPLLPLGAFVPDASLFLAVSSVVALHVSCAADLLSLFSALQRCHGRAHNPEHLLISVHNAAAADRSFGLCRHPDVLLMLTVQLVISMRRSRYGHKARIICCNLRRHPAARNRSFPQHRWRRNHTLLDHKLKDELQRRET